MKNTTLLCSVLLSFMLTACGGGGGSETGGGAGSGTGSETGTGTGNGGGTGSTYSSTAQGLYVGSSSSGYDTKTVVLENDQYWSIYGYTVNGVFDAYGLIQGNGAASNGSFSSTNLSDFDFDGVTGALSLTASYQAGTSFNGSMTNGASTMSFTGNALQLSAYNYNTAANLGNIAGTWTTTDLAGYLVALNIAADGTYSGNSGGCLFSGTLAPRATGKNVFDLTLTYGGAPCILPNQAQSGIAVEYLLPSGSRQLLIASVDSTRSYATSLVGVR